MTSVCQHDIIFSDMNRQIKRITNLDRNEVWFANQKRVWKLWKLRNGATTLYTQKIYDDFVKASDDNSEAIDEWDKIGGVIF